MENNAGNEKHVLSPQEEAAKAAIPAECDNLAKAGVRFVAVHFDGYGDDGATEDVKCFDSEYYGTASMNPFGTAPFGCRNILNRWFRLGMKTTAVDSEMLSWT